LENLVYPIDHTKLRFDGRELASQHADVIQSCAGCQFYWSVTRLKSIAGAQGRSDVIDERMPQLYLESLGISEKDNDKDKDKDKAY
jgi:hypothetical protein